MDKLNINNRNAPSSSNSEIEDLGQVMPESIRKFNEVFARKKENNEQEQDTNFNSQDSNKANTSAVHSSHLSQGIRPNIEIGKENLQVYSNAENVKDVGFAGLPGVDKKDHQGTTTTHGVNNQGVVVNKQPNGNNIRPEYNGQMIKPEHSFGVIGENVKDVGFTGLPGVDKKDHQGTTTTTHEVNNQGVVVNEQPSGNNIRPEYNGQMIKPEHSFGVIGENVKDVGFTGLPGVDKKDHQGTTTTHGVNDQGVVVNKQPNGNNIRPEYNGQMIGNEQQFGIIGENVKDVGFAGLPSVDKKDHQGTTTTTHGVNNQEIGVNEQPSGNNIRPEYNGQMIGNEQQFGIIGENVKDVGFAGLPSVDKKDHQGTTTKPVNRDDLGDDLQNKNKKSYKKVDIVPMFSGDSILNSLNASSEFHRIESEKVAAAKSKIIQTVGSEVAERIIASREALNAKQEVRISLKNEILPQTEVRISLTNKVLNVDFYTASSESAALLSTKHENLNQYLLRNVPDVHEVEIGIYKESTENEHNDGRSKQEYVGDYDDEKNNE